MKIEQYVANVTGGLNKRQVVEHVRRLRQDLRDNTCPPYQSASEWFKDYTFKSKFASDFSQQFGRNAKLPFRGNYVQVVYQVLDRTAKNMEIIEKLVDRHFSNEIMASGLTYLKGNLIQYIDIVDFATRYARKLLLLTYASEKNALERNGAEMGKEMPRPEMQWLEANRDNFFAALASISPTPAELEKAIEQIPDIVVAQADGAILSNTLGRQSIDPLRMGFISARVNPIYHFRKWLVEREVARYDAAVEERQLLEYRLLDLKNLQNGEPDPKLQQIIEYNSKRLEKLNFRIAKMEEEWLSGS